MKKKQRGDSNKQKIVAAAAGEKPRAIIKTVRGGETDINGVFIDGDCTGAAYRLAKAAGEGNAAALTAYKNINTLTKEK